MRTLTVLSAAALAVALTLTGCAVQNTEPAKLTFDDAKSQALSLRAEIEKTLPSGVALDSSDNDIRVPCGDDGAQFDGNRTVTVSSEFDRAAWLDSVAGRFETRDGWTVQKKVAADGSSEATSGVAMNSADGFYVRLGEFGETASGGPVVVLSASGPCVAV
jgi:hypothetical protein